jgi:hypothetical protein
MSNVSKNVIIWTHNGEKFLKSSTKNRKVTRCFKIGLIKSFFPEFLVKKTRSISTTNPEFYDFFFSREMTEEKEVLLIIIKNSTENSSSCCIYRTPTIFHFQQCHNTHNIRSEFMSTEIFRRTRHASIISKPVIVSKYQTKEVTYATVRC